MKKILLVLSTIFLTLAAQDAAAQARKITGKVTSAETLKGLPSVQVVVKGGEVGTLTDKNGNYALEVPANTTALVFSSLGYTSKEARITGDVVNVALASEAVALEGLVVTAMGITREKKALGVAVQDLKSEELTEAREANIVNALSGKVSGVQITNAGPAGGSSRIVIRGATSIAGNNQPLFIVDGVPIDNSAQSNSGYGAGRLGAAVDYGNAASDINPNDIASVTVLKGPNAAALYGSRAANGAVIITTKSGKSAGGLGLTFNSNVTYETPLRLPDYQNQYGQGLFGEFEFKDGYGGGTWDGVDESWGPKLDGRMVCQFFSKRDANGNCAGDPWVAQPNNVRDFFEVGRTATNNVSMATSSDRANVRMSLTDMRHNGMYPGQRMGRTTVAMNGGVSLTEKLNADASVNYIRSEGENRPGTGYDESNPMQQFVWFGRQVDINKLREYKKDGKQYNWNYNYHANPFWIAQENKNWDNRDRVIGNASLSYQFNDWLTGTVRSGTDLYSDFRKRTFAYGFDQVFPKGAFVEENVYQRENNTDFLLAANRNLTSDISVSMNVGGNQRWSENSFGRTFVEELSVPGIYNVDNAGVTPVINNRLEQKRVNSLYGSSQIGFRDYFFIDVTGRNDWSSTLPDGNNSYFYPSVSSSLVLTDALGMESNVLSFGKVRASWARVGNDADPYQLAAVYGAGTPFGGIPGYGVPNTIPNAGLKPEETESIEFGTDLRFFENRVGVDLTYYNQITRNQILSAQISGASGFSNRVLNAGSIRNQGLEVLLTATPVELQNGFRWDVTANWAKNNSKVEELYGGLQTLVLGGFGYWGVTAEARLGEPYGALYGSTFRRDENGNLIVDAKGLPLAGPSEILGNYNPDWTGGIANRISYGGFDLNVLFDIRQGGEIMSVTNMFGNYAGVTKETLKGREKDWCDPGIVVDGVTESGEKNTTKVCPQDYFGRLYYIKESAIYDASFIKLRELKLGWSVPSSLLETLRLAQVGKMDISLVGRNLWLSSKAPNIDPETAFDASNRQGFEFGQLPSARSIGVNIVVTP